MRVLWLVNLSLPEASEMLDEKPSPFGGWLINASKELSNSENIELSIAFPSYKVNEFRELSGDKIKYYPFKPMKENDKRIIKNNRSFKNLLEYIKPDIVHIYGTEMAHTLSMVSECKNLDIKTVISIQGLVSIYAKHIYANLPFHTIYGLTLRNLIMKDSVYLHKKTFELKGRSEILALKMTNHIIGRTTWDKACTNQINSEAIYHNCNETLREEFYNHKWNKDKIERYSIFISQGHYSVKGLHYVLEALPTILEKFPKTKLYISGKDITKSNTLMNRLVLTYYGKYIVKIINKLNLEQNVIFTGPLDEINMRDRFLRSNIYVCPSAIENSPNSLGEAMILGVPCIASDVGGVVDMLKHNIDGFIYQADAPYMLAHYVCELFNNEELAQKFSHNAKAHASITHDRDENTKRLIEIYNDILIN